MDPKHLMQLATIVELGSLTKAAQRLNTTQPSLSRVVKLIEDRVGGAVLRRDRYGVSPTEIGARLAEDGREIMRRAQRADVSIEKWRSGISELRVGVGPMLATTIMGDFLAGLVGTRMGYGLKIYCEYAARLLERLHNDLLDVAIMPYELNRQDGQLIRETLFQDRLAIFVGQDDPLAAERAVPPVALAQHNWISVGEISGLFDVTRDTLDGLGLHSVTPALENTGDVTMTFRILERTRSCSMLPFRVLGTFQDDFRIAPVDLSVELPLRNVGFWTTQSVRDRPECLDFKKRLSAYLEKLQFF
ncbi:LysR family transcriptional regulator [Aestuariicoccus sp. MJ-SS9]|uniref:LysR family transcriptional regulator n=1 Tax=Aestuariicoccus sp. MJ-SS9 TaxID=3079855 RepID=UPI0029152193|nr:LysR family transcriptional regulator [Aestuariicoccus sp. MJ-SS9]MDU8913838.1 LysR family transcriptional regulator [Aestuariicoccus sp. MJ-SS9]